MEEIQELIEQSNYMIDLTNTTFVRYMYNEINWSNRLIGIKGPRGIGKTTLLLQYIKRNLSTKDSLYVTADHFYFSEHRLFDLADYFVKMGGRHLFIDEIHKYGDWSKELKLIYDLHPTLQIVFTGSSILDIDKGEEADLSRRAVMYEMQGLSFREYLQLFHNIVMPVYSLEAVLTGEVKKAIDLKYPLSLFASYLAEGYYPFAKEPDFKIKLAQVVNQTLETDIPFYANLTVSTARKLKQLLRIISQSCPFKPNYQEISQMIDTNRTQVKDYLYYIEKTGLIAQLRDTTGGLGSLGKIEKIYLDNPTLLYLLAEGTPDIGNIRETFFNNQIRVKYPVLASKIADFEVNEYTFEVGGKNKGKKQIAQAPKGFIVKDNIEYKSGNILPLWHFGLLY